MIENLEINHLRLLSAVCAQGIVSAAAQAPGLSQQAASLQLKRTPGTATHACGMPRLKARP